MAGTTCTLRDTTVNVRRMLTTKRQLRKRIGSVLQSISPESISKQSEIVAKKVFSHPNYQRSTRVSIYLNTPKEISTQAILQDLFDRRKSVFVPRYDGTKMSMVRLGSMEDYDSLPVTTWNIKQPGLHEDREDALESGGLDLIITPGVAFTKDGHRLGHGKGYYDSFFAQHKKVSGRFPYSIALALREQVLDDVPVTDHDHVIDEVLYDESNN